jgi:hypothetical protein
VKRGDVVEFNERIPRFSGTKCQIVRVSRRTGGLTVRLLTAVGVVYPVGTELNVSAYELRSSMVAR